VAQKLTIGLSLSLTGRYAVMGRQAEAALCLFVADTNASGGIAAGGTNCEIALECIDDQGSPARTAEIYRALCFEKRAAVILGPYSSALTRAAAPIVEEAGTVMVNHGGADDDLYSRGYRMIVGVLTPASEYMTGYVHLLSTLKFWRKRVAIISSKSPFGRAVAAGVEQACAGRRARLRGVRLRLKYAGTFDPDRTPDLLVRAFRRNRINALVSAGSYEHDLAIMRLAMSPHLSIPVLGCIAAGVRQFHDDLGDEADGIVGPSQWEESIDLVPEIGPAPAEFARRMRSANSATECDYPAAQAYAAGLITAAAIRSAGSLDQQRLRDAFSDLRTTTFYGKFAIDRVTGAQVGHKMLLVQWHRGRKVIIDPEPQIGGGELLFPSGWRLLLASSQSLRINRRDKRADEEEGDEQD
jgi:branched-chain amino acid transport system substrate-binding protein